MYKVLFDAARGGTLTVHEDPEGIEITKARGHVIFSGRSVLEIANRIFPFLVGVGIVMETRLSGPKTGAAYTKRSTGR